MIRVALRSVRAHLTQFLLTALAVVLGVTFLSGTLALRGVLSDTFSALTSSTLTADLYVEGEEVDSGGSDSAGTGLTGRVDASLARTVAAVDGVASAHPYSTVPVTLVGADSTPVASTGAPSMAIPMYPEASGEKLVAGRYPQAAGEVALESDAMDRSGLSVGDTTHLVVNGDPTEVSIVGEFSFGTSMAGATIVGMNPDWLMPIAAPDGPVETIAIRVAEGSSVDAVRSQVSALLPEDAQVRSRAEVLEDQNQAIERVLGYVQTFLLVFVILAMFVGSFIIMNTFAMNVRQRQKEFALLRAVGASPLSVFTTVLFQAIVIGSVGSILGVVCGAGLTAALVKVLEAFGMPLPTGVPMTRTVVVISILVGLAVTVVGALAPSRQAALTPPVEAMRDTSGAKEKPLVVRTVIGTGLAAVGLAGLLVSWHAESVSHRSLIMALGAACFLLGLLLSSPALSRSAVTALGMPLRIIRPGGRLAARSLAAAPRRTAATSAALVIGMALVCAGAIIASSMKASIADIVNNSMRADFLVGQISTTGQFTPIPAQMATEISNLDGVESTTGYASAIVSITGADGESSVGFATAIEPGPYAAAFDPGVTAGSFDDLDATHVAATKSSGLTMGEEITITGSTGSVVATVVALADAEGISASILTTPEVAAATGSLAGQVPSDPAQVLSSPQGVLVTLTDGASAPAVQEKIEQIVAPAYVFSVLDSQGLSDQIGSQANQMLAILYGLLGLSIVIAILGIVNTLILSVSERTREIGLMRAVGMSRSQLSGQIVSESVLTAVYGTVLGAAVGVLLAAALRALLAGQGLNSLVIPWGQLAAMVVIAVIVGVFAALWPAWRASRQPVLEAIATE